jgi:hypothetical protein
VLPTGRCPDSQLRELADIAWARYQSWRRRQGEAITSRAELLQHAEAVAQCLEWRGIWLACEREWALNLPETFTAREGARA